jgi:hypothetical protein
LADLRCGCVPLGSIIRSIPVIPRAFGVTKSRLRYFITAYMLATGRLGAFNLTRRRRKEHWVMTKVVSLRNQRRGPSTLRSGAAKSHLDSTSTSLTSMNFRVPLEFHRQFKTYAAQHGVSMVQLLQEGFRLVKEQRG